MIRSTVNSCYHAAPLADLGQTRAMKPRSRIGDSRKDSFTADHIKSNDELLDQFVSAFVRFEEGLIDEELLMQSFGLGADDILLLISEPQVRTRIFREKYEREQSGEAYREKLRQHLTRFGGSLLARLMTDDAISAREQITAVREARLAAWPEAVAASEKGGMLLRINFGCVTQVINSEANGPASGYYDSSGRTLTKGEADVLMKKPSVQGCKKLETGGNE